MEEKEKKMFSTYLIMHIHTSKRKFSIFRITSYLENCTIMIIKLLLSLLNYYLSNITKKNYH
jgi:hypothetical protein